MKKLTNKLKVAAASATIAVTVCLSSAANASLIGDTITFNTYFPDLISTQEFLVGAGIECAACPSAGFVQDGQTLDIGADYIEFSSSFDTNFNGPAAIFEFLDLDWIPGPGSIVGWTLTTNFDILGMAAVSFTADSIRIDLADSGTGNSWRLNLGVIHSSVPMPGTILLFGLGAAGLGWSRRKKA